MSTEILALVLYGKSLSIGLLLFIVLALPTIIYFALKKLSRLEPNYRGDRIPGIFGLYLIIASCVLLNEWHKSQPQLRNAAEYAAWWIAVLGFGLLGLVDDLIGDKSIKGLRGHISAAVKNHILTSGLFKAIGGMVLAVSLAVIVFHRQNPVIAAPAAIVIALSANAFNLLDLRPGRSSAVFLLVSAVLLLHLSMSHAAFRGEALLCCVVLPAAVTWVIDSRAMAMMGDTGSNVLGASIGLAITLTYSLWVILVTLALLIFLHVVAEKHSITEIISRNQILNRLDRLTGVRQ